LAPAGSGKDKDNRPLSEVLTLALALVAVVGRTIRN
jgi:hypothetical protein